MPGSVVLVHGGCQGPWCWDRVISALRDSDLDLMVVAPDLLSGGCSPADPALVQGEVDRLSQNGPVIVCGHSFGGVPISALRPSTVAHLVYIASPLLDLEVWYPGLYGTEHLSQATATADGTFSIRPEHARELLYGDCADDDVADAIRQLRPYPIVGVPETIERPTWRDVPATYVCCDHDKAVHRDYMLAAMDRIGDGVRWPTSHSPMISRPDLVAELLLSIARRLAVDRDSETSAQEGQ